MKISLLGFVFLFVHACQVKKVSVNHEYVFENNHRIFSINFLDENYIAIKNTFDCNIDEAYKEILIIKKYSQRGQYIFTEFINEDDKTKLMLPYFEDENCEFLSDTYRNYNKKMFGGRIYYPDESLFLLPDLDTLRIVDKSQILYIKRRPKGKGTIGFVFNKVKH